MLLRANTHTNATKAAFSPRRFKIVVIFKEDQLTRTPKYYRRLNRNRVIRHIKCGISAKLIHDRQNYRCLRIIKREQKYEKNKHPYLYRANLLEKHRFYIHIYVVLSVK